MRSQYKHEIQRRDDDDFLHNGSHVTEEAAAPAHQNNQKVNIPPQGPPPISASVSTQENETTINALKRKYDGPDAERWLFATEDIDLAQHLPPQPLLLKVVDFFTTSFHHWIPYLHKQRLRNKVSEGICSSGLLLVLHALVAVTLRHMDPNVLFLDDDQIRRQCSISRIIVETHAVRSVSVESLQALIFIVFDYVRTRPQFL